MKRKYRKILLIFLIALLIILDYPILNKVLENSLLMSETGLVERIIDGDTIVINDSSIRLLGINSPEKGEKYYEEARDYLENLSLGKMVNLKKSKEDLDRYGRKLRYVFHNGENINLKIIEQGLANFYFPSGKDAYYKDFVEAWKTCVKNKKNLCEKSIEKCSLCLELKRFDYSKQIVTFRNKCDFDCNLTNWRIKDEGRKNFFFPEFILRKNSEVNILVGEEKNTQQNLYWTDEDYVWTSTGDTLFLRDTEDKLVLWQNY